SLVGGLADWFAVTALFRRPLGLPIPHTAIVSTRKERIGRILGNFVQNHFLSHDVIAAKLETMHLAERAARWLSQPENARRVAQHVASGVAKTLEALPDDEMRRLVHQVVSARLRATRVAPALGKTLSLLLVADGHQELLSEAVRLAAQAVHDNHELIRDQVRAESPWWVPGVVDEKIYERIVGAIERLLRQIATHPGHPLRATFDAALRDLIDRLEHSPEAIARTEAMKEDWLAEPGAAELSARLWETTRRAIVTYATQASATAPRPLEQGIGAFGAAVTLLVTAARLAAQDTPLDAFRANIAAIHARDRAAYLSRYLHTPALARVGPDGLRQGYDDFARGTGAGWPDTLVATHLRIVPVSPDVAYGVYRYRVVDSSGSARGVSERVFVRTPAGWRVAVTTAFPAASVPPPPMALVGGTLVDGTGAAPLANAVVVMRGGRIACAGSRGACPVPADADTVSAAGKWIIP